MAERNSSAAAGAAGATNLEKPKCPRRLLQLLVRRPCALVEGPLHPWPNVEHIILQVRLPIVPVPEVRVRLLQAHQLGSVARVGGCPYPAPCPRPVVDSDRTINATFRVVPTLQIGIRRL